MTRYGSFHIMTECGQCGQPLPINGPLLGVECSHCFCKRSIAPESLLDIFKSLEEEYSGFEEGQGNGVRSMGGNGVFKYTYLRRQPQCDDCKTPLEVDTVETGAERDLVCSNCKASTKTFPAPAWLRESLPQAVQCFGGEQEFSDEIPASIDQSIPEAVAMSCPACGGGLSVTGKWDRTHPCSYCQAQVFIPDALWKRLHPIKTARHWGLRFEGHSAKQLEAAAQRDAVDAQLQAFAAEPLPRKLKPLCIRYVQEAMTSGYDAAQVETSLTYIEHALRGRVKGKATSYYVRRLLQTNNGERAILLLEKSGSFMRLSTVAVITAVAVVIGGFVLSLLLKAGV